MKLLQSLVVLLVVSAASAAVADIHPLSDEYIAKVNQKAKTWRAGKNFEIEDWEAVKRIASGVLLPSSKHGNFKSNPHNGDEDVPDSFDSREAWPKCDSIKQIRDQSLCGSCWAQGAVAAMSDRICIHSNQTQQVYVSADDLIGCCSDCSPGDGCIGAFDLTTGWVYWQTTGIVTGGLYNSSQGCKDYSLPPCEHYNISGDRPTCNSLEPLDTPVCSNSCYDKSLNYEDSKTYGQDVNTFDSVKQIQLEIYKNGPVEGGIFVYQDFLSYKSGVYQSTTDILLGMHAVKILGWGMENDTPYWLVANSWNNDWGDNGYFKILRGENHCQIETYLESSLPKLP